MQLTTAIPIFKKIFTWFNWPQLGLHVEACAPYFA